MATTEGRVRQVTIIPGTGADSTACVWIGGSIDDAEIFVVIRRSSDSSHRGAFKNSIVDTLSIAQATGKKVIVSHGDTDAEVVALEFND